MTLEESFRVLPAVVFLVFQGIQDVLGEDCGNDKHCFAPYVCCTNHHTCCYDSESQDNFRRAYKLHVWNMWYFWFVIIFILMSCFGGCGYYRRRRMAAIEQQRQTVITTRRNPHSRRSNRASHSYLAYVGPAASEPPDISFLPPPYSEVVNLPSSYPGNKSDLPPYPGPSVIAPSYAGTMPTPTTLNAQDLRPVTTAMPKPPPYSEFAGPSQTPASSLAVSPAAETSQATDNFQQETSHPAIPATDNIQENSQSANQCSSQPSTNQSV